MAIKVAIVSPSRLFSEGLQKLIEDDAELSIVIATQAVGLEETVRSSHVILIDRPALFGTPRHFFNGNGCSPKLLLLENGSGPSPIDAEIVELISKGVMAGILSAESNGELVKKAVKVVASGELWLGHMAIRSILTQATLFKQNITPQESEIAGLILKGYCNKEIARELKITEATVKSHCNRLFKKFNVSGRLQLGLKLKGLYEERSQLPGN
jgi:DNA-binding NarL/FixJ family response regulator